MYTQKNLPRDASTTPIQEANNFALSDGTASPVTSPLSLNPAPVTLTVPQNAAEFIVYPVTNDLKVSSDSTLTTYDLVTKGNKEPFPCAGMNFIYIQGSGGDTVYFRFHEV